MNEYERDRLIRLEYLDGMLKENDYKRLLKRFGTPTGLPPQPVQDYTAPVYVPAPPDLTAAIMEKLAARKKDTPPVVSALPTCPCGRLNRPGSRYCAKCGQSL
jgi:hypothetical protein